MDNDVEYVMTVVVHDSSYTQRPGGACAVLVDLMEAVIPPDVDFMALPEALILRVVPEFLGSIGQALLSIGFVLHFDVPEDSTSSLPRARVRETQELGLILSKLATRAEDRFLYPLSIWAFPTNLEGTLGKAVKAFYALGRDDAIFAQVLSAGAFRIAVAASSVTLSTDCTYLDQAVRLVRAATVASNRVASRWQA